MGLIQSTKAPNARSFDETDEGHRIRNGAALRGQLMPESGPHRVVHLSRFKWTTLMHERLCTGTQAGALDLGIVRMVLAEEEEKKKAEGKEDRVGEGSSGIASCPEAGLHVHWCFPAGSWGDARRGGGGSEIRESSEAED